MERLKELLASQNLDPQTVNLLAAAIAVVAVLILAVIALGAALYYLFT